MRTRDAVDEFMVNRRSYCSMRTIDSYAYHMEFFVTFFADRDIESITPSDLERFIAYQRSRERADLRPGSLSPATICKFVRVVKALFHWFIRQGYIVSSPASDLRGPRSYQPPRSLTREQTARLLACLDDGAWIGGLRDRAVVLFGLDTACRRAEILGLRLSDLNLDERYADVTGKGCRIRRVVFSERTGAVLRGYISSRKVGNVFLDMRGKPMTEWCLQSLLQRLGERVGFALTPHMLRHTAATMMLSAGCDISSVSTILGHARVATTEVYVRAARAQRAQADARRYCIGAMLAR